MNKEFLLKYLDTNAPSTYEVEGQKVWLEYMKQFADETYIDNYCNAVAIIKSNTSSNNYKVVIEAHADEIGWAVKKITKEGLIYVASVGGVDYDIVLGQSVNILGSKEIVKGIFGWIPIHLKDRTNPTKPSEKNVFIDIGVSSDEEVKELGIEVGDFILPNRKPEILHDKNVVSKALDNKLGGFVIAEVARKIKENGVELPYDLYIVNSSQEEVGLRGAKMIAERINPDVSICIDVCHDTTNPVITEKNMDIKIGDGVMLSQAPSVNHKLLKLMKDVAKSNEIPYHLSVAGRYTGTDTESFNLSNSGVVSALISLPIKYMHTPNEIASLEDTENTIKLILSTLDSIDNNHNFLYF